MSGQLIVAGTIQGAPPNGIEREGQDDEWVLSLSDTHKELNEWRAHCQRRRLNDRLVFVTWLKKEFTPEQLALAIDSEKSRDELWQTYLRRRFGP